MKTISRFIPPKAGFLSAFYVRHRFGGLVMFSLLITNINSSFAQSSFEFVLPDTEKVVISNSNPWGLVHTPDGSISYRLEVNEIRMWFTASVRTILFRGTSFETLTPFPLQGGLAMSVLGLSGTGFDSSYAGAYSVIPAANGRDLLMFYHAENQPCNSWFPFLSGMGLARSSDGGVTWQRRGQVLTSAAPKPTDCSFQIWGVGNPNVYRSRDGRYLYMLFNEWLRGNPVSRPDVIYLARAPVESDGEPGSWQKYANGLFSQPGFGGLGTPVIGQPPPDGPTTVYAALPSVSFNVVLNRYIVIFQSRLGFHIATSEDGVQWDTPRLIWTQPDFYVSSIQNVPGVAYPSLISPDQPSQMTTSQTGYLYFARGFPNGNPPHVMSRRRFEIKLPTGVESSSTVNLPRVLGLEQNYPNPFNPSTTILYQLPRSSRVSLKVYNVLGQEVAVLVDEQKDAGRYHIDWSPQLSSGVYLYRIQAGEFVETKKLLLLR